MYILKCRLQVWSLIRKFRSWEAAVCTQNKQPQFRACFLEIQMTSCMNFRAIANVLCYTLSPSGHQALAIQPCSVRVWWCSMWTADAHLSPTARTQQLAAAHVVHPVCDQLACLPLSHRSHDATVQTQESPT